jgi:phage-related tail protein
MKKKYSETKHREWLYQVCFESDQSLLSDDQKTLKTGFGTLIGIINKEIDGCNGRLHELSTDNSKNLSDAELVEALGTRKKRQI